MISKNNVLLVTTSRSSHASNLEEKLSNLGVDFFRLDTDSRDISLFPQANIGEKVENFTIGYGKNSIDLERYNSVWWDEVVPNAEIYENMEFGKWAFLETQKASDWILAALDAFYVNDPGIITMASNKVRQLKEARKIGLAIPDTLISSDYDTVSNFTIDKSVYKPLSRPTLETVGEEVVIYSNVVKNEDIERGAIECKLSLFQKYVEKKVEIRSYVIGDKCFSAEIHSQMSIKSMDDWRRYDISKTPYHAHQLPSDIEEMLISLTKKLNLDFSAIDLIQTPEEKYKFLELNPQGMWLWVEKLTGLPITENLASHLAFPKKL